MAVTMVMMNTIAITETAGLAGLHHDCFACGADNHDGLQLHFEVDANGVAAAAWQPSPVFRSYADRVHGGVIASLLDSAMVHALFARHIAGVTAELTIRYLQSVNLLEPDHVRGWVECERHGVYFCRAEVDQAGALAVRGSAKFLAMPDLPRAV